MKSVMMGAASVLKKQFKGDANLGYYPDNKDDRIITNAALRTAVGMNQSNMMNPDAGWFKFMDKGKLLYVAKLPFRYGVTIAELNALGIATGTKTIEIEGRTYKVRCLNGSNNIASMPRADSVRHPSTVDTEFSRLFYRMTPTSGLPAEELWENFTIEQLGFSINYAVGSGTVCQEYQENQYFLIRGAIGLMGAHVGNYSGAPNARGWRPVLELVA